MIPAALSRDLPPQPPSLGNFVSLIRAIAAGRGRRFPRRARNKCRRRASPPTHPCLCQHAHSGSLARSGRHTHSGPQPERSGDVHESPERGVAKADKRTLPSRRTNHIFGPLALAANVPRRSASSQPLDRKDGLTIINFDHLTGLTIINRDLSGLNVPRRSTAPLPPLSRYCKFQPLLRTRSFIYFPSPH